MSIFTLGCHGSFDLCHDWERERKEEEEEENKHFVYEILVLGAGEELLIMEKESAANHISKWLMMPSLTVLCDWPFLPPSPSNAETR